jgi:signal transduction histidine kinase
MRAPIDIAVFNEGDAVHLTVSDQGIGLTHEELGQLFQRYSRTRRVREQGTEGAGLGLYVCRGIVEAHGGHIWAESPGAGNGATFHVVLPRMPGQVAGE